MKHNKRYLLFVYPDYYPAGGWGDLLGAYKTLQEAQEAREEYGFSDNNQIIDMFTLEDAEPLAKD